jgi:uncharacterized membrane protein (DUF373 family)
MAPEAASNPAETSMNECKEINDLLISRLKKIIRFAVRLLAILMTAVILWGVVDVGWVLYQKLIKPPFFMLTINDILATFGAFMAVLIAIEIFINITIYLREDVIHVKIVMATALMAIARKVIILDFEITPSEYVFAMATVVFAMSVGYFLIMKYTEGNQIVSPSADHTAATITDVHCENHQSKTDS